MPGAGNATDPEPMNDGSDLSEKDETLILLLTATAIALHERVEADIDEEETLLAGKGGSTLGRKKYHKIKRRKGATDIDREYFSRMTCHQGKRPLVDDEAFRGRYRISSDVRCCVREASRE